MRGEREWRTEGRWKVFCHPWPQMRDGEQYDQQQQQQRWHHRDRQGAVEALARWYQSRETRGCRGTMLSTAEKKVCVQTEKHDNFCPLALCFAPFSSCHPVSRDQGTREPPHVSGSL